MKTLSGVVILFFLVACHSAQSISNANPQTKLESLGLEMYIQLIEALPESSAELQMITGNLSSPGNNISSRINITNEGYFLKINRAKASGSMPFFGTIHYRNPIHSNDLIEFEGTPKRFQHKVHKAHREQIRFSIKDKSRFEEEYELTLDFDSKGNAFLKVSSNKRSDISYKGKIVKE